MTSAKKFKLSEAFQFGWEGLKGFAYNSKDDFENASAAYFEVTKSHGKTKTTKSDRIYYIIEGVGEFTISNEAIKVEKTDVIIVPRDTPYDYKAIDGVLKLFLIHVPAYDGKAEVKLE
jgi:mannose-6-phosphate isomerase-like protein (cupin superfamily)